jgi:nucleotide-binding universal stress UspA family protein
MFSKLLVPTDGSDHAERAVVIASDLAAKYGAQMVLLHVIKGHNVPPALARFAEAEGIAEAKTTQHVEPIIAGAPHVVVSRPVGVRQQIQGDAVMRKIADNLLEAAKAVAAERGVASIRTVTTEGDPADRILEYARDEGADGIVVGSRGLSDLKGAFFGSVSHKVCHEAHCTCITVT